ncbi:MAG: ATP synthase F1 subunit delta [Ignavibacteria bacterium]|nr:ATP synthase F1 subunit delta [Ignavibacteria bacterium]
MQNKVVNRYSLAMYEAAGDTQNLKKIIVDCQDLVEIINTNRELRLLLNSPIVDKAKKTKILSQLFKGKINELSLSLLLLLVRNGREMYTSEVLSGFLDMVDDKEGVIKPLFTSAVALNDNEKNIIKKDIDRFTNKNSKPVYDVNADLIGGFTIRLKDTVIDGSVVRQLELMKESLKTKTQ